MNSRALFREAFTSLRRNRLRSLLTILGISVGVGAFICVVAIGHAGSSRIEDQLQSLGDNFVWIEAGSRARNGMRAGARGTRSLVLNDAVSIVEQVPMIKSMSPNVDGHVQVVYGGEKLGHPIQRGYTGIPANSQMADAPRRILFRGGCGGGRSRVRARSNRS